MTAFDFEIPEEIRGNTPTGSEDLLANGPFVVVRQGVPTLGLGLKRNGEDVIYWDGGRAVWVDDTFITTLNGNEILVKNPEYGVDWVIRPLTIEDVSWALPSENEKPTSIEDFKDTITELLSDDSE